MDFNEEHPTRGDSGYWQFGSTQQFFEIAPNGHMAAGPFESPTDAENWRARIGGGAEYFGLVREEFEDEDGSPFYGYSIYDMRAPGERTDHHRESSDFEFEAGEALSHYDS